MARRGIGYPRQNLRQLEGLVVAALFAAPFLWPGLMLFNSPGLPGADLPQFHLPHQRFIQEHLRTGVLPFWNPHVYAGSPEFGNPEMALMYPPVVFLRALLRPREMLLAKYLLHLGLLGAGGYLFFRMLAISRSLAFAGGLTLQLSGFAVSKVALPNVADSAAWLPLMLAANLFFLRRASLKRGLLYSLLAGCMLSLFFPQITLSILLLLFVQGLAHHVSVSSGTLGFRTTRWLFRLRILLGLSILVFLATLLRYPEQNVRFPEPGWRQAFEGLGRTGLLAMALTALFAFSLIVLRRLRLSFRVRAFAVWLLRFSLVWFWAALFAAPQLLTTAQLITLSNQKALQYEQDEDFFTGAQAYGTARDFLEASALVGFLRDGSVKEPVNNMAVGPAVYLLFVMGLALGLVYRCRPGVLLLLLVGSVFGVYMAAPVFFDVFRRLPFFGKFAGMSRYLAFLSFALVALALLASQRLSALAPLGRQRLVTGCLFALMMLNVCLLAAHSHALWRNLLRNGTNPIPKEIGEQINRLRQHGERTLVDRRGERHYVPRLMMPLECRCEGIGGYGPLRPRSYDLWLRRHNDHFGVNRDDYRAAFFEPEPSVWTRALRTRFYVYPPWTHAPSRALERQLTEVDVVSGWRIMEDGAPLPPAWPEADIQRLEPAPAAPAGWNAEITSQGLHHVRLRVSNPGGPAWAVLAMPYYPGWTARVDGRPAPIGQAHGFLQAVKVREGASEVSVSYKPRAFACGWALFLFAVYSWIALAGRAAWTPRPRRRYLRRCTAWGLASLAGLACLITGFLTAAVRPDSLNLLRLDCLAAGLVALIAAVWVLPGHASLRVSDHRASVPGESSRPS